MTKILGLLSNRIILISDLEFSKWVKEAERRLLQETTNKTTPNVVVAKDGIRQYKKIKEVLARAKKKRKLEAKPDEEKAMFAHGVN